MDDSSGKLNRRTFLYGAGGLTVASVLAGCSGGSSGNNGTKGGAGGTKTKGGAAAETATDTQVKTGAGTSAKTETGEETKHTDTETETETETNSDSDTETQTQTDTETGNETEPTDSATEDEDDEGDNEDYGGSESHRLTFGEIREQPPSTLDNLNQEYVELINTTGSTIDLSGYTITYGDGAKYTFDDGFKLPVDHPVTVHTGSGNDSDTDVYVGRDEVALNYKGPDKVVVKNANGTVVLKAIV